MQETVSAAFGAKAFIVSLDFKLLPTAPQIGLAAFKTKLISK